MYSELITFLPELTSVTVIAILMAISPGADFVMVTRNSVVHSRASGLYSSVGISVAIWLHVSYCIAGLALVIAQSTTVYTGIKFCGAAYLIYLGIKSFYASTKQAKLNAQKQQRLSHWGAFKMGFITNATNVKTTVFFLSIFTQVVDTTTPIWVQLLYGMIISLAHLIWFSSVAMFLSQPALFSVFQNHQSSIEKGVGAVLIIFGLNIVVS